MFILWQAPELNAVLCRRVWLNIHGTVLMGLTQCAGLHFVRLHHFTGALRRHGPDTVAVLPAVLHIRVAVAGHAWNFPQFLPRISSHLLSFHQVVTHRRAPVIFWRPPPKFDAGGGTLGGLCRTQGWSGFIWNAGKGLNLPLVPKCFFTSKTWDIFFNVWCYSCINGVSILKVGSDE